MQSKTIDNTSIRPSKLLGMHNNGVGHLTTYQRNEKEEDREMAGGV